MSLVCSSWRTIALPLILERSTYRVETVDSVHCVLGNPILRSSVKHVKARDSAWPNAAQRGGTIFDLLHELPSLADCEIVKTTAIPWTTDVPSNLKPLPLSLRRLKLHILGPHSLDSVTDVLRAAPNVTTLHICLADSDFPEPEQLPDRRSVRLQHMPCLTTLKIQATEHTLTDDLTIPALLSFDTDRLEELVIDAYELLLDETTLAMLAKTLKRLIVADPVGEVRDLWDNVLPHFTALEYLDISWLWFEDDLTLQDVLHHSPPALRTIKFQGTHHRVYSTQPILSAPRCLREIEFHYIATNFDLDHEAYLNSCAVFVNDLANVGVKLRVVKAQHISCCAIFDS